MRFGMLLAAVAATALGAGCYVDIQTVSDPGPAFAAARAEASRVAGHRGPADELKILVYDRHDRQLIRVGLPISAVEHWGDHEDIEIDLDDETVERVRSQVNWSELEKAPLGPLVEVDEEGGDKVLVWLQ